MYRLEGQRFGFLTVVNRVRGGAWMCRCDCGKVSYPTTGNLLNGNSKSCGHLIDQRRTTHGRTGTPEHRVWKGMRSRCLSKTDGAYRNYGGRGITVCPEWEDFTVFLADMGPKPGPGFDLDRIDGSKGYSKENCRWISHKLNLNNKRTNRFIEHDGRRQTVTQWATELGVNPRTLHNRISRGWSIERAFTEPVQEN